MLSIESCILINLIKITAASLHRFNNNNSNVELYNTEEHEEQSDGGLFAIHVEFEEAFCVGLSFIRVVTCQERLKGEKLSASINGSGQL